jgi:hypothetical protein
VVVVAPGGKTCKRGREEQEIGKTMGEQAMGEAKGEAKGGANEEAIERREG